MIELDKVYLDNCINVLRTMPDGCIDMVLTDPPYEVGNVKEGKHGSGHFGNRKFYKELAPISEGISDEVLDELVRVCRIPNIYLFCSKQQLPQFLNYAVNHGFNYDVLTWHKTNPVPACNDTYLSDTEYCVFMRGKGAPVYGTYETKRKWYLTTINKADKDIFGHPTCKPVQILKNLVTNSTQPGQVVLDPYCGSGSTLYTCKRMKRHFIGIDIDERYWKISKQRVGIYD